MIVELLLDFVFGVFAFVIGLFPELEVPGWLDDGAGMLADLAGYASGLGAWIPFPLAGTVLGAAAACMVIGFVIKLVRMVLSLFTGGGSSAA